MSAGCHRDVLSKTLKGSPHLHILPDDVLKDHSSSSHLVKTFLNFKPLSPYYVSLSIQPAAGRPLASTPVTADPVLLSDHLWKV